MRALLSQTFFSGLELRKRSNWRAIAPDKHHDHSLIQHCVHILQAHTYIAIWYASTHGSKTQIAYDCAAHQTMALLLIMYHFITTNSYVMTYEQLLSITSTYTLQCLSD